MKTETRKITEGAMITAITAVFLLLDRQFGNVLSTNFSWLLSIPMIIYASQTESKYAWMVFFSVLFVSVLISPLQIVFYMISALILGMVYGSGIRQKWNQNKLLLWTIGITFTYNLLSMYVFASFFGYDLIATRNEFINWMNQLELFGNERILFISPESLYNVIDIVSFFMLVILEALCVHLVSHLIFIKMKLPVERITIDLGFRYPKFLSIGGIVSLILMMASNSMQMSDLWVTILTFFYLSLFIVNFVYGMIVIRCMQSLPKWIWIAALILPVFWPFVMMLGIVDGLMDGKFRKRWLYGKTRKF